MHKKENIQLLISLLLAGMLIVIIGLLVPQIKSPKEQVMNNPTTSSLVIVDATTGFQNSHIFLKKGQKVVLEPEGRIHLALDQIYNRAKFIKPLIINNSSDETQFMKNRYPLPTFNEDNVFNRNWIDPEGEKVESDFLDKSKLRTDLNWGALLVIVMPSENFSSQSDPFEVLKNQELKTEQLSHVSKKTDFEAKRDGWLTFIINEAVASPISPSRKSRVYEDALQKAKQKLTDARHNNIGSIPLVWFYDNVGAFHVNVTLYN